MKLLALSILSAVLLTSCSHLTGTGRSISATEAATLVTNFANHELQGRQFIESTGVHLIYPRLIPTDWDHISLGEDGWMLEMNTGGNQGFYADATIGADGKHPALEHFGFYETKKP
jgi:hypothetical protein